MKRYWIGSLLAAYGCVALAGTPLKSAPSRGELLYNTHCVACHNEQVHWRAKKLVTDVNSLFAEVDRWQANDKLEWSRDDIAQVSGYLNRLHYHFRARAK